MNYIGSTNLEVVQTISIVEAGLAFLLLLSMTFRILKVYWAPNESILYAAAKAALESVEVVLQTCLAVVRIRKLASKELDCAVVRDEVVVAIPPIKMNEKRWEVKTSHRPQATSHIETAFIFRCI